MKHCKPLNVVIFSLRAQQIEHELRECTVEYFWVVCADFGWFAVVCGGLR